MGPCPLLRRIFRFHLVFADKIHGVQRTSVCFSLCLRLTYRTTLQCLLQNQVQGCMQKVQNGNSGYKESGFKSLCKIMIVSNDLVMPPIRARIIVIRTVSSKLSRQRIFVTSMLGVRNVLECWKEFQSHHFLML